MPVVGVRLVEGRCGSTLLMRLLATNPQIVFDDRYPAEYRFLSYFARLSQMMTEPFDESVHIGVTPFFFGSEPVWGPIPFRSELLAAEDLTAPLLRGLWAGWSSGVRAQHPEAAYYAEKLAVEVEPVVAAGIPLRVIDLVRDPRDVLASIRAFTAGGIDGFGRTPGMPESEYLTRFVATQRTGLARVLRTPDDIDRIIVRYEDLVTDLAGQAERIGDWLGFELDHATGEGTGELLRQHMTAPSPEASVGRWRHDLDPDEARRIGDALRDLLAPFGYEL